MDIPDVVRMIRMLAEYEQLAHVCRARADLLESALFPSEGPPQVWCLIGEHDGVARGFALYFRSFSTFLCRHGIYLEDLYVEEPFRGRGLGRLLLQSVAREAARAGGRLEWSVLEWNEPAIRFYRSIGARMLDDWRTMRLADEALAAGGSA